MDLLGRDGQRAGHPLPLPSQRLKKYSQEGHLTLDMMRVIMGEEKKSDLDKITFTSDTLRKYFPRATRPSGCRRPSSSCWNSGSASASNSTTAEKGEAYEGYFSP